MFWQAEVIGPFDSPYCGRSANATTPDNAVKRLKEQLERNGFIGRLVEVTGRGPQDPLSDDDGDEELSDEKNGSASADLSDLGW